jgi:hypothetical protein
MVTKSILPAFVLPGPSPRTNYGAPPPDTVIVPAIKAYFSRVLVDPESARFEYGKPYKAYLNRALLLGGGIEWSGWAVEVIVNAKNRMGGYAGAEYYHVTFNGDRVVNAYPANAVEVMFHAVK